MLYVDSGNRHSAAVARGVLREVASDVQCIGPLLRAEAPSLPDVVLAVRAALTPTEAEEVRVFYGNGVLPTVPEALTAEPIRAAAAKIEHQPTLELLADESAFYSLFQPIVDLETGRIHSYEALLRASAGDAEVMPGAMFAAAEAAGRIHVLDRIGREVALRRAAGWLGGASLFINFIPTSIYRPEVCLRTTMKAAAEAGIDCSQIVFEVVESHAVTDPAHLLSILDYYRASGCRVALDDVGAGYSSLNLLAAIRPDVVKIDRELVQALPDPAAVAVVRAIVNMSHDLGARVIAECVETEAQAAAARALGADWAQGWLFGRPQPAPAPTDHRLAAATHAGV